MQTLRGVVVGLLWLTLGLGVSATAGQRAKEPGGKQEKSPERQKPGEADDSPRLMLPVDVFDKPAAAPGMSASRAPMCPVEEGFRWGRLRGAFGIDEVYAASAACGRVYTVGYAQGQMQLPDGTSRSSQSYDLVLRSTLENGTTDWLAYFGTDTNDYATAVTSAPGACPTPYLYMAGYTSGALQGAARGGTDAFVIRFNAAQKSEQWRAQFGSDKNDWAYGMAVDAAGNTFVVGATQGNIGFRTPPTGTTDMFIAKFLPDGTRSWVHQLGVGGKATFARAVTLGANGSIYVTGYTSGSLGGQTYGGGTYDVFVARYQDLGTQGNLLQTRLLGTAGADYGYGLTASVEGGQTFVYLTGQTNGTFAGSASAGGYDVFLAKMDAALSPAPVWLKQTGGPGTDYAYSIIYTEHGPIVAGASETDLETGAALGSVDMLMLSYNQNGGRLFSDHLGGPSRETARAIAVDGRGNLFLAGSTDGILCNETFTGGIFDSIVVSFNNGCRVTERDSRCASGGATGDPHYYTFDQLFYDFQAAGDFVLARVAGDPSFDLQARQCPWYPGASVATFRSVGALVAGDRIEVQMNGSLWVNGAAKTVSSLELLPGGGALYRHNAAYVIAWPTGERLTAYARNSYMDIFLVVPKSRGALMRGLFGRADGSKENEYTRRDGSPMRSILSFQDMYRGEDSLATHWRTNAATDTNLLEHGTGCTDQNAPLQFVSATTLTPAQRAAGEAACAGVTDPLLKDDCIMDVGVSGDPGFVATVADINGQRTNTGQDTVPITKIRGVYFNNFTGEVGTEWDSIVTSVTPSGDRMLLGEFNNQNVRLTLSNLGTHSRLLVSFDLFIINAWTGDDGLFGSPTSWRAAVDGTELINATFSNWDGTFQSYPTPGMPAQSDAVEADSLGYPYRDSVYRITLEFDHSASNLTLDLSAEGLSGIFNEAWGVANFEIQGR